MDVSAGTGIKLTVRDGRPLIEGVYANGHGPYRFLLDTGAETNQIHARLARSIGLEPSYRVQLATAAGVTEVAGGNGASIQMGSVTSSDQEFLFTDLASLREWSPDVQGVLGQAFLAKFDYLLDLHRKRLVLGGGEFEGARVPMEQFSGRLAVFTSLGHLVLDSGSNRLVLFRNDGRATKELARTAAGFLPARVVRKETLVVEGQTYAIGEAVALPRPAQTPEDGLLAASLFRAIYVCNSGKYMILNPR